MKKLKAFFFRTEIDVIFAVVFLAFLIHFFVTGENHTGVLWLAFAYATGVILRLIVFRKVVNKYMTDPDGRGLFGL